MQKYFMYTGAILVIMVLLTLFATGLVKEYTSCGHFYEYMTQNTINTDPEGTGPGVTDWMIASHCAGVENNVYLSYYFIALGVALLAGGFIVRR